MMWIRIRTTEKQPVLLQTVVELWDKKVWDPMIVVQIRRVEQYRVLVAPFYRPQNTHLSK